MATSIHAAVNRSSQFLVVRQARDAKGQPYKDKIEAFSFFKMYINERPKRPKLVKEKR